MTKAGTSKFDLVRLLRTVFHPKAGERVGVFIDLERPEELPALKFLADRHWTVRRIAYEVFYRGMLERRGELPFSRVMMFAYEPTGGSNLDLPDEVVSLEGKRLHLEREVLAQLDIVLYLSTYSATAPITALAKRLGFRGATMHGCNEIILETGLAEDYDEVSARAERFRQALTRCEEIGIEFEVFGQRHRLRLDLGRQEAQKSHGICRAPGEIANLPAGEIYWVPADASGHFPLRFKEDGTIGLMEVKGGRICGGMLWKGEERTLRAALERFEADPATGELGELGLGTRVLPVSGADIQDEKILGTFHLATGRSDHLGGQLDPTKFRNRRNATHEDILFAPHKTPEIGVPAVWMRKDGRETVLIRDYEPTDFVKRVAL